VKEVWYNINDCFDIFRPLLVNGRHSQHYKEIFYIDADHRSLVGKPEGKKLLGRPRCRWEDNIKMTLREIGWGGMGWIDLAQDRDQ
jgi:hypothetical protein